jgi:sulfhydrogenase subunit delta
MFKPKLAIISLTSCEGCQFAILDLGQEFLDIIKHVELVEFRLVEERQLESKYFDIALVEGNPITKANLELLKAVRQKSKILITLGNCADMAGIPGIRNYQKNFSAKQYVYNEELPEIPEKVDKISNIIKPDYVLYGCPINAKEFVRLLYGLINNLPPEFVNRPVCFECQTNGYKCLLMDHQICLGPITRGGCEAVCLKSSQACWGCRGLCPNSTPENLFRELEKNNSQDDINKTMEVFGLRDELTK